MKKAIHVAVTVLSVVILLSSCGTPEPPMKDMDSQQPAVGAQWYCADGSVYDPLSEPNLANVSRNDDNSWPPTLCIDSSGNPHIAWFDNSDDGNYEILYTRWDGSDWVCADGSVYDPLAGNANVSRNNAWSQNPSLALDSSGNPHIAWHDGSFGRLEILYTRWNGSDWVCADNSVYDPKADPNAANVSRNSYSSCDPSLALDSSDNPHIAWHDERIYNEFYEILYTRWNGSEWACADGEVYDPVAEPNPANLSRNSGRSTQPSLALDSSGKPHISWEDDYGYINEEILYAHWNGTDWVCAGGDVYDPDTENANVSWSGGISHYPSLALDSSGNPHIAWEYSGYGRREIIYTYWNGMKWVCANGDVYDPATRYANVSWNSLNSYYPSLALDSSGNPHIAWFDYSYRNDDILYTYWNGNKWVLADGRTSYDRFTGNASVSRNSGYSWRPSLSLDFSGNPHIAWRDDSYGKHDIYYIHWKDGD